MLLCDNIYVKRLFMFSNKVWFGITDYTLQITQKGEIKTKKKCNIAIVWSGVLQCSCVLFLLVFSK